MDYVNQVQNEDGGLLQKFRKQELINKISFMLIKLKRNNSEELNPSLSWPHTAQYKFCVPSFSKGLNEEQCLASAKKAADGQC
eukprot:1149447-Pelagomonas_calceolata.AAC.7